MVDRSQDARPTTSEGQSYALFFALAANDRPVFDRLLAWTRDNLADGDLGARLPAWLWGGAGRRMEGIGRQQRVGFRHVARLRPAGGRRLWREPSYAAQGRQLALRILREETADLPGLA
ncbi:Endoglucanase precursor [Chromobacterium violaceum]|uniref:cellulase n=1 Tax=Chromobacterium violaceum TaxID=536 RepID=A0A447TET4_CHRVL|nr:Endoglucanase precursor [Chromobacterium violaceum]